MKLGIIFSHLGLLATFGTGCAFMANLNASSAPNPLSSGAPLTWQKQPQGIPFEGQQACTVWPIQSAMTVKVTDAQICIQGTIERVADGAIDGSSKTSLTVASDGSQEKKGGLIGQFTNSVEAQPHKAGTCVDKTRWVLNVWAATYDGCVPNSDMNNKPVLTKDSTYLAVGEARWKFPVQAAPAPAPASAPASAVVTSAPVSVSDSPSH
jgi:hypothetical protein